MDNPSDNFTVATVDTIVSYDAKVENIVNVIRTENVQDLKKLLKEDKAFVLNTFKDIETEIGHEKIKESYSLLQLCVKELSGDKAVEMAKVLIAAGADVEICTEKTKKNLLHLACESQNRNFKLVKLLIETKSIDINGEDLRGYTPFLYAAKNGNVINCELLVINDAEMDYTSKFWKQILAFVYNKRDFKTVQFLQSRGISEKKKRTKNVYKAISSGNISEVENFISKYGKRVVNYDKVLFEGNSPHEKTRDYSYLQICVRKLSGDKAVEMAKVLIAAGADVAICTEDSKRNLLHLACRYGDSNFKLVDFLIKTKKIDINEQDCYGYTPLIYAAINGDVKTCELLIENGADIGITSDIGKNALDYAIESQHAEIVEFLKSKGAITNEEMGEVSKAIKLGNVQEVKNFIIKYGKSLFNSFKIPHFTISNSDLVSRSEDLSPLQWCVQELRGDKAKAVEMTKVLIAAGADVAICTEKKKRNLLHLACKYHENNLELVDFLIKTKKIDINEQDCYGYTPLIYAAINGDVKTCKLLLNKGAKIDATSKSGKNALDYAIKKRHAETVKFLESKVASTEKVNLSEETSSLDDKLDKMALHGESNKSSSIREGEGQAQSPRKRIKQGQGVSNSR